MANQILETLTPEEIESSVEFLRWQREYKRAVIVEEGRKQGLAEGIEQGLEQGIYQEKVQTARNMKVEGFSSEQIERLTGLAEHEY